MSQYLPTLLDQVAQTCRSSNDPEFRLLSNQIDRVPREKPEKEPLTCPTSELCLETAIRGIPADHLLRDAVAQAAPFSPWEEASRGVPEFFPGGYAYAMLADESPPADDDPVRMGLLLQRGNIPYPGHAHDAEEFYFILSGEAHWRIDAREFTARPGDLIHHAPCAVHAMQTGSAPLLALWVWRGNLSGRFWYESAPDVDCPRS